MTRLLEEKGAAACSSELTIANIFVQQAKRRINQNLRRVNHNEDEEMEALADFIVGKQSFPWDTI